MKLAIVLFNLGGPDSSEAVEPFLRNLFGDPAILVMPGIMRKPLAWFIARRRAQIARAIYEKIGGRSPIVEETEAQARALERTLTMRGYEARAFVAMRYWKPFSSDAARAVKAWNPDRIVLLPLYPQFSTTTTDSSLNDWHKSAAAAGIMQRPAQICCYPDEDGFMDAQAALIGAAMQKRKPGVDYRLLLSAHGLPKRIVAKGDPYQWQVEKTAAAIVERLGVPVDWTVCYQSRVGRLEWIGPSTDDEIRHAGAQGKGLIVAPIAFVCEHSETLVELDIEYGHLASASGVADYIRVPTVGTQESFIAGLARLAVEAAQTGGTVNACGTRICPRGFSRCIHPEV
jgi:ferrochelatase